MRSLLTCLLVLVASCGTLNGLPVGDDGSAWERSGKFQGDIVFKDKNGILSPVFYWPNNTLVYKIAPNDFDDTHRDSILNAFNAYAVLTCVRMREATSEDKDYVYIQGQPGGCYSYVGRIGGAQTLNLEVSAPGTGCFRHGTIMHELLHALGFYHQQSASDRDDYVTIMWENIQGGTSNQNFDKYPDTVITDFGIEYDYGSVMHYGKTAFSANGKDTIVPLDPNAVIGQRNGLSNKDIEKLERMYDCRR